MYLVIYFFNLYIFYSLRGKKILYMFFLDAIINIWLFFVNSMIIIQELKVWN
jgi:hypothetical protein